MLERYEDLRWLVIPGKHLIPFDPNAPMKPRADIRIEIIPMTSEWLVAPERTWDEIDGYLEGRLNTLQDAFQNPESSPFKVARDYGMEKSVSGNMARFLAYVDLLDSYRVEHEAYSKNADVLRDQFEEEKGRLEDNGVRELELTIKLGIFGRENIIYLLMLTPREQKWPKKFKDSF